jgi:hypothetical protein
MKECIDRMFLYQNKIYESINTCDNSQTIGNPYQSLIHNLMVSVSTDLASVTESGSAMLGNLKSKWWAESKM